jgi:DNA-binding XRE family transcriptional regulator
MDLGKLADSVDFKQVGKRIKFIRRRNRMTQANLAKMTELHDTFISRIETGAKKRASARLLRLRMCSTFRLTTSSSEKNGAGRTAVFCENVSSHNFAAVHVNHLTRNVRRIIIRQKHIRRS